MLAVTATRHLESEESLFLVRKTSAYVHFHFVYKIRSWKSSLYLADAIRCILLNELVYTYVPMILRFDGCVGRVLAFLLPLASSRVKA